MRMRPMGPFVPLLVAAAFAAVPFAAIAAAPATAPAFAPTTGVRVVTLRNGLRLLLAPDTTASAVDVAVWYHSGAAQESPGRTGLCRLFERLMFEGSANFPPQEHIRLVQGEGGAVGAYTGADYACTYQTVPPAALEMVLRLEADRMGSLRLTAASLEAAKRAVREERRRRARTQPVSPMLEALHRLAWPGHHYGRPLDGLDEDLDRISLADCQAFHAEHHAPNNATVTIIGRFDPDGALQAARRWLEPLRRQRLVKRPALAAPAASGERRAQERMVAPLPTLLVNWRTPRRADPDGPALALLARILSGSPSARLQRALTAEPLRCVSVQGALDSRRDGGQLDVVVAMRPGADSSAVESALLAEADSLVQAPVSEEELETARRQEEAGELFARQTVHGCAEQLGPAEVVGGDWRAAALHIGRLREVTAADVQRVAARVLAAGGRSVLLVTPELGAPGAGTGMPPVEGGR